MIDLYPKKCNLCFGKVIYTSNAVVYYGKEYGSGKCYICQQCRAYTGTHKPRPREALGLLANERMRKGKIMCHDIFDSKWRGKPKARKKRKDLYTWLAKKLSIPVEVCHFGWFDLDTLIKAYRILEKIKDKPLEYNNKGDIVM